MGPKLEKKQNLEDQEISAFYMEPGLLNTRDVWQE